MDQATNTGTFLKQPLKKAIWITNGNDLYWSVSYWSEELQEAERLREEAEASGTTPPAAPRARIPFTACLEALSEPETLTDFWSSAVQSKTTATK